MRLTILIAAILCGGLRIAGTVAYWPLVVTTSGKPCAIYFILSGSLLIAGGSVLIWMLQKKPLDIEYRMALAALLGGVWYWLERFWMGNLQSNLPFAIIITLFVEAVFWFPVLLKPHHLAKGIS